MLLHKGARVCDMTVLVTKIEYIWMNIFLNDAAQDQAKCPPHAYMILIAK